MDYQNSTITTNKQHHKLIRLARKAEKCTSRDEARKIIKKATKAYKKLSHAHE